MNGQPRASYQSYYDIKAGRSVPITSKVGQAQFLMISGTEGLVYDGTDQTAKIRLEGKVTLCGVEFTADTTGWTKSIEPEEVKAAGDYTVTFTKEGSTPITKTFTVAECSHTGLTYKPQANNKHGGTCPICNTEVSEEHTWADGVCSVCNLKAKVQVQIGNDTTYYGDIDAAWAAAKGSTSTVTLLDHVTASGTLTVDNGGTVTFDGGDYTLTSAAGPVIQVNQGCTLKFVSGTVHSTFTDSSACYGIDVRGMLEMTGGTVTMDDIIHSSAVSTYGSGSRATISGGELFGV